MQMINQASAKARSIAKAILNSHAIGIILGAMALACHIALADGFRLPNQDPDAIARGNAFVATADNPSAIYYNPAGITQLSGQQLRAGIYAISSDTSYTSPTGAKANTKTDLNPVPQLYYTASLEKVPLSFGLGVYVPYGLALDWGDNNPFNTIAQSGSILYVCINPVAAWKVNDQLSIAVGPTINYSQAKFQRAIGFLPNDEFKVSGSDTDYGFNAGVRWQPIKQLAFGASYRYKTTLNYHGTSQTLPSPPLPPPTTSSAAIRYPQYVIFGVSYRPTENWNIEVDIDWTDWSDVKQIVFQNTGFGNLTLQLNYRSSFMYEIGATRQLGKGYFASLGYFYSENSSPDQNFTPIIPDSDLHLGGLGFGHKGKRWDWTLAYQFGYNPGRTVQNNQSPSLIGQTANGTYRAFNNAFNLAATLKF